MREIIKLELPENDVEEQLRKNFKKWFTVDSRPIDGTHINFKRIYDNAEQIAKEKAEIIKQMDKHQPEFWRKVFKSIFQEQVFLWVSNKQRIGLTFYTEVLEFSLLNAYGNTEHNVYAPYTAPKEIIKQFEYIQNKAWDLIEMEGI